MPNPKLQYDDHVPAFLQRLKGQLGGPGERSNIQQIRAKKELINYDDDAPTIVDETNNETLSKEEFEQLQNGGDSSVKDDPPDVKSADETAAKHSKDGKRVDAGSKQQSTFGASTKRKLARIIDAGDQTTSEKETAAAKPASDLASQSKKTKTKAKKGKKIKLSFAEENDT